MADQVKELNWENKDKQMMLCYISWSSFLFETLTGQPASEGFNRQNHRTVTI